MAKCKLGNFWPWATFLCEHHHWEYNFHYISYFYELNIYFEAQGYGPIFPWDIIEENAMKMSIFSPWLVFFQMPIIWAQNLILAKQGFDTIPVKRGKGKVLSKMLVASVSLITRDCSCSLRISKHNINLEERRNKSDQAFCLSR